jgi:hypothetical protein
MLVPFLLGQGLKKSPIGQKLDFANHPYLCKGLLDIDTSEVIANKADAQWTYKGNHKISFKIVNHKISFEINTITKHRLK